MEVESRINADYKMETFFKIYMDYKVAMNDSMDGIQEMEIDYEIEVDNKKEMQHKIKEESVRDTEPEVCKASKEDNEHCQDMDHTTNMILGHIALDHASSSIASLAYHLFIYRDELGHRKSNALQLTQTKIDITAKLIMNCAGKISECSSTDIHAFTRLFTFQEFLAEQKWILSGGLSNYLGIKDVDDFDYEDFDWS